MHVYSHRAALLAFSLMVAFEACAEPCDWKLSTNSLGPLKVGMTLRQAEKAIDMPLDLEAKDSEIAGDYLYKPRNCPNSFRVILSDDTTPRRITVILAASVSTIHGLHIGSPEGSLKSLRRKYGERVKYREYDFYSTAIHSYAVSPLSEKIPETEFYASSALVYFAPQGTVTEIRAGSARHVFRVDLLTPNPSINADAAR